MRCLHCGKELALLKRWTGGGEFCSDAHKQSYQDEYNRLALNRLLHAQAKPREGQVAQNAPPARTPDTVAAPVAVEEPVEEVMQAAAVVPIEEVSPPPPQYTGFFVVKPASAPWGEGGPCYLEPWMEGESKPAAPAPPEWRFQNELLSLPAARLVPLKMQSGVDRQWHPVVETGVSPKEFTNTKLEPNVPFTVTSSHEFPSAGPIVLEIAPVPSGNNYNAILNEELGLLPEIARTSAFLDRSPAGIEFPAEDSDVTVATHRSNGAVSASPVDITIPAIPGDETISESPATPRAALEALSKLHQDLVEHEPVAALPETAVPPSAEPTTVPVESQPIPRGTDELLAIPLKSFAPPKPILLIDADALLTLTQPLLPRLKALPLRPKVALAPPGFRLPSKEAPARSPLTEAKMKAAASVPPPRPDVRSKPTISAKQSVQPEQPVKQAQPPPAAKAVQPPPSSKPVQPPPAAKAVQPPPTAKPTQPVQATKPAETKQPATPARTAPAPPSKQPTQSTPVSQPANRAAKPPATPEPVRTPPPPHDETLTKPKPPSAPDEPTLTFETLQLKLMANTGAAPFWGSLQVKLVIALVLILGLVGAYFGFSGKSHKPSNASISADGVGPSIMMGEGGWVQGWAGDPVGAHLGRQITIYRPSLTLSDYRVEFQGQIETKSLGWVFRAADPDDYYAMKLTLVSSGLPQKAALIKYMILKGRETELGRIPLNIPVSTDTVFSIRMDVRGPRINTFVQGQPVDIWTNDQLKSGGVGFLNERGERGRIKSVSISYLSGAGN